MFRCCSPDFDTLVAETTYASTLLYSTDNIQDRLLAIENQGLYPCFTGWCTTHKKVSFIINTDADDFPTMSAYALHMLTLFDKTNPF
jgi:hypothetical protein